MRSVRREREARRKGNGQGEERACVRFDGGFEAVDPEEGDEPPVPEPPHARVLRAAVAAEFAVSAPHWDPRHHAGWVSL